MSNNLIWILIEPATSLFEVMVAYLFLRDFLGKRAGISRRVYFIVFLSYFAGLCLTNVFLNIPLLNALFSLTALAAVSLLFDGNVAGRLFSTALFIAFDMASDTAAMLGIMALSRSSPQLVTEQNGYRMAGILISKLLLLGTTRLVCFWKIEHASCTHLPVWQWGILLSLPFGSIVILYALYSVVSDGKISVLLFVCSIGMLYFNIILYYLFAGMISNLNAQARCRLLEQQVEYQMAHYRELEASQKEIRRIRHDMKNHLLCMENLLHSRRYAEAEAYAASLTGEVGSTSNLIDTGNAVLDSLLSAKLMTIAANKIQCENMIAIPAGLPVSPIDLCILFGNSFDNAVEACARLPQDKRKIRFALIYRNKSLMFNIVNTCGKVAKTKTGFLLSAKRRFQEPGIGLSNMERAVQKYDGVMEAGLNDGMFSLSVMLNHMESRKNDISERQK